MKKLSKIFIASILVLTYVSVENFEVSGFKNPFLSNNTNLITMSF